MQPRRRLGFRRFVLAVMLGLGAWWGAGYFSEARPQWRTSNTNGNILYPVAENTDGTLALAYELKVQQGQTSAELNEICILNANTGQIMHAMKDDKGVFDAHSYYSLIHAQPRILGDKAWRVVSHQSENSVTYELRVWDFTRTSTEQVVKQWSLSPGEHFGIAFFDSHSPYFVTQTSQPWHPLLVGMSLEGWSQLTAALAFTPHLDVNNPPGVIVFNANKFVKTGMVLPCMQSWKLPENLTIPLKPLATWTMPPLRRAWPPAMSADLSWLAFGDTMSVQEWNENTIQAIRQEGMLRYDGRTGKQLASPTTPLSKMDSTNETTPYPIKVTAAGNLLLVRPANQTGESFDPFLLDAISGDKIDWPASIPEVGRISDIHEMKHDPSTVLVFQNVAVNLIDLAFFRARPDNPSIYRFHRDGNKWSLMNQITIGTPGAIFVMPNCISHDEIVVQTIADTAPPFVRELCEKHQWLAQYVEKLWPNQQPAIKIIDLSSGKCLKTIFEAYPSMPYQFNEPKHFFVTRMKKDNMTVSSLEAWRLPLASQTWSPWWSRGIGLAMFLLCIRLLSRKQPVMKLAAS